MPLAGKRRQCAEAGFTLIETIVALVVLSAALMAFYGFLSSSVNAARRAALAIVAVDRRQNALELARVINPMETPDGVFDLGSYRIRWTSALLEGPRQSGRYPSGTGVFKLALYHLTFSFPDDPGVPPIELTQMGYRRDRLLGQPAAGSSN